MSKSSLIVWNVVLTIGVLALLFIDFAKEPAKETATPKSNTAVQDSTLRIAFVNLDSLESQYALFNQKKSELDQKRLQSQTIFDKKMKAFQDEYAKAQQGSSTMTQEELARTEQKLQQEQADIQQLQTQLQTDLQDQLDSFNKQIKDSLDSYLKDYNQGKQYTYVLSYTDGGDILFAHPRYDITADVVKGMNERVKKPEGK